MGLLDDAVDGPLRIDTVPVPGGGTLGLLHCPGRSGTDGAGRRWARSLADDLAALDAWGADALLSLVEPAEFARLGVPHLPDVIARHRIQWLHVPVTDMGTPDASSRAAWAQARISASSVGTARVIVQLFFIYAGIRATANARICAINCAYVYPA